MGLVQAICPYCDKAIKTDTDRDAAICPFCLEPYVVEKAIRKYGQVNGINVDIPKAQETSERLRNDAPKSQTKAGMGIKAGLEVSEDEKALAQRIVKAVMEGENDKVTGLFTSEGIFGSERELRKEIQQKLDVSLFSPDPMGSGMVALLQEYNTKYRLYDVVDEGMDENALVSEVDGELREAGITVNEVAVKNITVNRCEWYETKTFFGLKAQREKRLVSKTIKGLFVSCERECGK